MMTQTMRFNKGDVVRAAISTQGLLLGRKYVVMEVSVQPSPVGLLVNYFVAPLGQQAMKAFEIVNGHLILQLVKAAPTGSLEAFDDRMNAAEQPAKEDIANALQILGDPRLSTPDRYDLLRAVELLNSALEKMA